MNTKGYDQITERMVALLEGGTVPWQKPWKTQSSWPRNYISKKPYRGINVFLLGAMGYESPLWLTFHQADELGATVRKGEKACPVVFWKQFQIQDEESGDSKKIPLLRLYHVFNVAQCDGLQPTVPVPDEFVTDKPAEIIEHMPLRPTIKHGMNAAFYSPTDDAIGIPTRERFHTDEGYFSTLFHELVHSTGHEKRLNRATLAPGAGFGSDPYCKEELIAEMGATFLCGHAEIIDRTIQNSTAYIKGWLGRLQNDKTLIVQAAAQAQKAVDFIIRNSFSENDAVGF